MKQAGPWRVAVGMAVGCGLLCGQSFTRSTALPLAEAPSLSRALGVATADFNGDGKPDLAVSSGSSVHVFLVGPSARSAELYTPPGR